MSEEVQEVRESIPDDISKSQIESAIGEWIIGKNAERNRALIRRRLFDGITFEKLSEEFDLSVRQTKSIFYRGERIIFKHL